MVINEMKTRVIKIRSLHLLSSLLVAIAWTHLLKPVESFAQTTMPSKLTLRNGSQPSDSLIKALLDWKELEGQRVTISDVNLSCLNDICMLVGGGQGIRIQSIQLKRDVREQILRCSVFGCPVIITGVISNNGRNPILEPQNITFLEGTQYNSTTSQTSKPSSKIADGEYRYAFFRGEFIPIEVKGGQYRGFAIIPGKPAGIESEGFGPWKPISKSGLRFVRKGVIYNPSTPKTPYWCSREASGWQPFSREYPRLFCTSAGLTSIMPATFKGMF
jgi:hypothetical protein